VLVYGDQQRTVAPQTLLKELARDDGRWLDHDSLRSRFITLAGLTQGVADEDFTRLGQDRRRPNEQVLLDRLVTLGAALMRSWDEGCSGAIAPTIGPVPDLPISVSVRLPEGYAFYALYPEAYGEAARPLQLSAPPRLIGLRSIGTGLAAIAAAALDAPAPIILRPTGDPFARVLKMDEATAAELLDGKAHYIIVDEGPGLSGSSFGCVADWLEDRGIPCERIAFLPGHDGNLGSQASERHRRRWADAQRPVVKVERLRSWIEAAVGPILRWDDVSGGGWRPFWSAAESDWPAVNPMWERSKYRVRTRKGDWLVRFAGLGSIGEEKLAIARLLEREGFGAEVGGLTHGWLIQRWHDEARPTRPTMDELAAYLRLRACLPSEQGASLDALVTMVRRNAPNLHGWNPEVETPQSKVRPVCIDGRMQAHEWLRLPGGQLLKADALDHHQGHDLVGCQDLAWDVAGAIIELGLSAHEARGLEQALGVVPELTAFYRIAYAAFQLGAHRMSETMVDAVEAERHRTAARRYELALVDAVKHPGDIDQSFGLGIEALA
jgi:hypothetical protein